MQGMPSQRGAPGGMHWVSIVGYDSNNFYYIDTCPGRTGCGTPAKWRNLALNKKYDPGTMTINDPYLADLDPCTSAGCGLSPKDYPRHPFDTGVSLLYRNTNPALKYTWAISQRDMWDCLTSYISDNGFSAVRGAGI